MRTRNTWLRAAIDIAGGVSRLAETLGLTRAAVSRWTRVPEKHVMRIADLTGIPAYKLRPDLYRLRD